MKAEKKYGKAIKKAKNQCKKTAKQAFKEERDTCKSEFKGKQRKACIQTAKNAKTEAFAVCDAIQALA